MNKTLRNILIAIYSLVLFCVSARWVMFALKQTGLGEGLTVFIGSLVCMTVVFGFIAITITDEEGRL